MKLIAKVKKAWKSAPIATAILGVALVAALVFTVRLAMFWIYWSDPENQDQLAQEWMTPGYFAQSWDVPREVVIDALPRPSERRHYNFQQLSAETGVPVADLMNRAQTAIDTFRAEHPAPGKDKRP